MALPSDDVELGRWVERIVTGWRLEHHPAFTIFHAVMLGMPMTRKDYDRIVRAYVDTQDEALTLGKNKDGRLGRDNPPDISAR